MLTFDYSLLIQFATYVVLLYLLNLLLYRPLRDLMERRRETIQGSHKRADQLEGQINEKMARYQEQLERAKQEAAAERAALKAEATKSETEQLSAARQDATAKLQTIRAQVAAEAEAARAKLEGEIRDHALNIAARILGREVK